MVNGESSPFFARGVQFPPTRATLNLFTIYHFLSTIHWLLNLSVAETSASIIPGSAAEWPASGTT